MSCPCCAGAAPIEPLYGCCVACATDHICRRCVSCHTWHHDHPANRGIVVVGDDYLSRCAGGCAPVLAV